MYIVNVFPPGEFISYPGGRAAFTCASLSASEGGNVIASIEWLANSTVIDPELEHVDVSFIDVGNGLGMLQFTNLSLEYNNSNIRCRAFLKSGGVQTSNDARLLLLQGW